MTRGLAVVLAVGLVTMAAFTTAGASNLQGSVTSAPSSPPATTTAAATPNGPPDLPPGTSASGIDNATMLLEAHRSLLDDRTYSVRVKATQVSQVTDENGTFLGFDVGNITLSADRGSNATHVTIADENMTHDDGTSLQSYWVTDEVTALKTSDDNGLDRTTYFDVPRTGIYAKLADSAHIRTWSEPSFVLRPYLVGLDYEYSGTVTRDSRVLHRFTSTGPNATAMEEHGVSEFRPPVERVDATVLIDEQGVVHAFDASVTRSRENESVTTGTSYEVTNLGDVTPVAPDWVTEELPHLDASLSENGTVVTIQHTAGMTVTKAGVLVSTPTTQLNTEFVGTFESGETLYLYVLQDDADRVVLSETRPEVNASLVRLGSGNASITPWRMVTENQNFTRLEVTVRDDASNRTTPSTTGVSSFESPQRGGFENRPSARFRKP